MWKIAVGLVLFAVVALYLISKAGEKIDMSGEKHGADAVLVHAPAASGLPAKP